jgi:hypothetical protein
MSCRVCELSEAIMATVVLLSTDEASSVAMIDPDIVVSALLRILSFALVRSYQGEELGEASDDVAHYLRRHAVEEHDRFAAQALLRGSSFVERTRLQ